MYMNIEIEEIQHLFAQSRFNEALDKCNELLKEDPNNLEILITKARILAIPAPEVSNPNLAMNLLKKAIKTNPIHAELHEALGDVYNLGTGDYELAIEEYKKAIELNPEKAQLYYALASLYQHPGVHISNEEVLAYLQKAINLNPCNWELRRELGTRLWESGNLEKAEREYENALKCKPLPDDSSKKQIELWLDKVKDGIVFKKGYRVVIS